MQLYRSHSDAARKFVDALINSDAEAMNRFKAYCRNNGFPQAGAELRRVRTGYLYDTLRIQWDNAGSPTIVSNRFFANGVNQLDPLIGPKTTRDTNLTGKGGQLPATQAFEAHGWGVVLRNPNLVIDDPPTIDGFVRFAQAATLTLPKLVAKLQLGSDNPQILGPLSWQLGPAIGTTGQPASGAASIGVANAGPANSKGWNAFKIPFVIQPSSPFGVDLDYDIDEIPSLSLLADVQLDVQFVFYGEQRDQVIG